MKVTSDCLNDVLLLHILHLCQFNTLNDLVRFQNIVFIAEYETRNLGLRGFNYHFYRWDNGPFSKHLVQSLDNLNAKKLIVIKKSIHTLCYKLTENGKEFLKQKEKILNDVDSYVIKIINEVVRNFEKQAIKEMINEVYKKIKITEEYQMGQTILEFDYICDIIDDEESNRIFDNLFKESK